MQVTIAERSNKRSERFTKSVHTRADFTRDDSNEHAPANISRVV